MANKALPCPTVLRQLLRYEPQTGKLFWKPRNRVWFDDLRAFRVWNTRYAGKEAFTSKSQGYFQTNMRGCVLRAHQVIWSIVNGAKPTGEIDHINGIRLDNRLHNLRDVSRAENTRNKKIVTNNTSGVTGVGWMRSHKKWRATINHKGRTKHLGLFDSFEDAVAVRLAAEVEYGFHPNHGRAAV
ncbi:HNH endonuclease signature motif containing protein [Yoonia sp.]|uniref:HNH endonuclease signature motif containing protein n=1 Tax=Yoonia sp. TaxID=2212373 RepID=UPI002E09C099|nr:HNH endonuclease signature motif containing protein [Yoonia sp.]